MKRYEKATIVILTKPRETVIEAMYNPEEYSLVQEALYENTEKGQPAFKGEQYQPLTVTLFFDTYAQKTDVRSLFTQKIAALTHPTQPGEKGKQPPECIFTWGSLVFQGRVQKVEQKFTLFLQDGTPVRANVTVTISPTVSPLQLEQMLGIEACRKLWTVKSGERLDMIAYRALGDAAQWRKIAAANGIVDPLIFPLPQDVGRVIVIPD